ncbi:hypothetical protein [Spiroplasma monobiae]|uniref:Uncharacterized protein n=1 Tax=Spiroplasma monobiae MQ-1 TaxID=1336748 RepID=A0A2K9LUI7_SPISQ|nr:hypothetical protein [Spiroplasma monobiae]AUM62690.1 hypothetical protein SMONO_v1c04410 [Spiroplasma monobiae MQ-1]
MGKIKLLKNNKKSLFMIISLIVFSVVMMTYSLTMMFSPIISKTNFDLVNIAIATKGYKKFLAFFLFNGKELFVASSNILIYWIPLALSGLTFILMLLRLTIHLVGYKAKTKKGVARIVRPIRSYQLTMVLAWTMLVLLIFASFLSFLSASPFLMGIVIKFIPTSFISIDQAITSEILPKLAGQFGQIYWLSFGLFSKLAGAAAAMQSGRTAELIGWLLLPIIIPFIALVTGFVGTICGECSWWTINLIVLRDIDLQTGAHLVENYEKVEKPKIKIAKTKEEEIIETPVEKPKLKDKKQDNQEYLQNLGRKCTLFFKNLTKMLEDSKNTDSILYKQTIERVEQLTVTQNIDWNSVSLEIETQMNLITETDRKFVELIEQLMINPRINLFGRYKSDLEELIEGYKFAIKTWDLLAAEIKLEQIFAIAFRNEELLPKVGYCLKNRVSSSWKNIDQRINVLTRLEMAKNNRDYKKYREICAEVIKEMSPIKPIITSYVDKIIYN